MKLNISAFIITLNEELNIKACLESLDFCAEIIIVDSGSTDKTLAIIESLTTNYNIKLFHQDFLGYRDQKNYAMNQCKHEWVLSIDADERISPQLKQQIVLRFNKTLDDIGGFAFHRTHYFDGKVLKYGALYPDTKLRLVRKNLAEFTGDNIHEVLHLSNPVYKIEIFTGTFYHRSWTDAKDMLQRQINYADKVAKGRYLQGKSASFLDCLLRPTYTFFYRYIFRLGFLDGYAGLLAASAWSAATSHKYFKLYELSRYNNSQLPHNHMFIRRLLGLVLTPIYSLLATMSKQKEIYKPDNFVISIGNMSMGGTGKTPLIIHTAKILKEKHEVCLISRGYKSKANTDLKDGDEALIYKKHGLDIYSNPDRVNLIKTLKANHILNDEILILDDAYQHSKLGRDVNICVVDCSDECGLEVFPSGNLRENIKNIQRADCLVFSHAKLKPKLAERIINKFSKHIKPATKIFYMEYAPSIKLPDSRLFVGTGLGNPAQFIDMLAAHKAKIADIMLFPDHHDYANVEALYARFMASEAEVFVCTEKDWVKLKSTKITSLPYHVVSIDLQISPSWEEYLDSCFAKNLNKQVK